MTGTGPLLRLAARRDRVLLAVVVGALVAFNVGSAKATLALYPTTESLGGEVAALATNPAFRALYGPMVLPPSPDSFAVLKSVMLYGIFLCLAAHAIVRRHTRLDEEEGRLELVAAGVVGRRAPLTAAVLLALIACAATALLSMLGMIGIGMDPAGTVAFALGWLGIGAVTTGISAVAAQLATTARGAGAIALGTLGVQFAVRALGDSVDGLSWVSWLSYLGWTSKLQPYGANRFWVAALFAVACAVLVGAAYALQSRRDLGAGLLPARPGPAGAGRWLGTPFGLAWRLQRGSLLGWTVAMVCGGVLMGVIAGQVGDLLKDPAMQDMLRKMTPGGGTAVLTEQTLTDLYLAVVFSTLALVVAAYGIAGTLRLRGEERGLRAEPVLATATSRWRFLGSHLVVALLGAAWLMIVLGFVTGVVRGLATGDLPGELPRLLGAALAPLPAVWLCIGITVLIYGLVPQWSGLSWAVLAAFVGIGELGGLLNLPRWLLDVSPFSHVPALPGGVLTWAPLLVLAAIAVVLLGGGSTGFRRRDIG